jgi:uncharacterized protein Usg
MQNVKSMTTAEILYRMEELREYETTDATLAEFAALWDEKRERALADAAVAAQRMMRGEI